MDHVGEILVRVHVLVVDEPESMLNHVRAKSQRLVDLRDLEYERLPVTLEALELEGYLSLVLDPLIAGRRITCPFSIPVTV